MQIWQKLTGYLYDRKGHSTGYGNGDDIDIAEYGERRGGGWMSFEFDVIFILDKFLKHY